MGHVGTGAGEDGEKGGEEEGAAGGGEMRSA